MANDTVANPVGRPKSHRENRKKNQDRQVADNQARAITKFILCPPRKARLVIDEVRGQYALDALAFLRFIPNRAAGYISKTLASAVANAANNHNLDPERLKLVEARVDEGPRLKRVQPRAQGRAYRILKRMCHITVIVEEVAPKPKKPKKQTGSRAQAARQARQGTTAPVSAPVAPAPAAVLEETVTAFEETTPVVAETPVEVTPAPVEVVETAETVTESTTEETKE